MLGVRPILFAASLLFAPCLRLNAAAPSPERAQNLATADRQYHERLEAFTNNPDVLVLPGLIARRDAREVSVFAESAGISSGDPLEFALISEASEHDYEALAVAFAKPSAVYAALRFIGLAPGKSPDPAHLAFWPKGERVIVTVKTAATNAWAGELPVERLLWNVGLTQALPQAGFVFVDAPRAPDPKQPDTQVFLPDENGPGSVVALYNEPATVLDVPRMAPQGSVYGSQKANPHLLLPPHTPLEFVFRPERERTNPRVLELVLTVLPPAAGESAGPRFTITGTTPGPVPPTLATNDLARFIEEWVRGGHDPFVRVRLDAALRLGDVHTICLFLRAHESESGVRIEPPEPDQLYYRAFIPDEGNRRREDRVRQPWELRLRREGTNMLATVTHLEERWHENQTDPEILPTDRVLAEPSELRATLDTMGPGLPVILIFADPDLTHGELMRWVQAARPTHGIIHVYLE